jgi:enolase-phosphatase E1
MTNAILLDIEGTTTPIDFVQNTLFPYAKARVAGFVEDHFDELKMELAELAAEHDNDADYTGEFRPESPTSIGDYLKFLIDNDRKSTPLKSIQGMIWQKGYESRELQSSVFDDVPPALKRWKDEGKTIAIYSSGSMLAQKLLFKYTDHSDLTECIDNYFDTNIGHKRETESYRAIADELELPAQEILFVSDVVAELDAAREAGMQTALAIREGNAPIPENQPHWVVHDFNELELIRNTDDSALHSPG